MRLWYLEYGAIRSATFSIVHVQLLELRSSVSGRTKGFTGVIYLRLNNIFCRQFCLWDLALSQVGLRHYRGERKMT